MAHYAYDPAKEACSPEYTADPTSMNAGPGGNHTLIENNEKGIQETMILAKMATQVTSPMASDNQSTRVGVYRKEF
jgi:hypothetical protein